MNEMIRSGVEVNVQAKTALLKGYVHSGMLREGSHLFDDMCSKKGKHQT
jgi:pentatricopeptide repeat protein